MDIAGVPYNCTVMTLKSTPHPVPYKWCSIYNLPWILCMSGEGGKMETPMQVDQERYSVHM
jgi:hypothetical protein